MSKKIILILMLAILPISADVMADSEKYLIDKINSNTTDTNLIIILVHQLLGDIKQVVDVIQETLHSVNEKMDATLDVIIGVDDDVAHIRNYTVMIHQDTHDMIKEIQTSSASSIEANARAGLLITQSEDVLQRLDALEDTVQQLSERLLESGRRSAALESLILDLPTVSESLTMIPTTHNTPIIHNMSTPQVPDMISEQEAQAEEERRHAVPGALQKDHSAQTITAYHFKQYGDISGDTYTLNLGLHCNRDIFVDEIYAQNRHNITKVTSASNALRADDMVVYDSQLQISGHPYDIRLDMYLEQLNAPTNFDMTITQTDVNNTIQNSTISQNIDIVDVHVEWYTVYDDAACSILFDGQSGFDGSLVQSGHIDWGVTIPKQGLLNDFASTLHCQNSPVMITAVHAAVPDWPTTLSGYGSIRLSVPDSAYKDIGVPFEDDGTIHQTVNYTYAGADLLVSGSIPVANTLVLKLEYVTTANTFCTILP